MSQDQTVNDGSVVSMHYKLTLDDGRLVDSSEGGEPLAYLHGAGNIVPGLEQALTGKSVGEQVKVAVPPASGYGERQPEAVQDVPKSAFPADADLQAGVSFQAMDQDQNPLIGTITKVEGEQVTVDFNHPLAGLNLNFEVEITDVRPATDEEKDHGHVHGPGDSH